MKTLIVTGILLAVLLAGWIVAGYVPTRNIETPKYKLLSKRKNYEVRLYAPRILAEVEVSGDYTRSLNIGFRKVADYIFGNNTARVKIAMTAPVLHEQKPCSENIPMTAPVLHEKSDAENLYKLAFVMPASYKMDTIPMPNNAEVTIRDIPESKLAVSSFGGYATFSRVERETAKLQEALKQDNLVPAGRPVTAQYNPPWTPPFMRRNEIMVELR
jgi:hypothetical protein